MIAHVRGKVAWTAADQVVLDVAGIGYHIWIASSTRTRLPGIDQEAFLYTSLQVREDSMTLYGFSELAEKELFEALLVVSGIGPKVALAILSGATPEQFCRAVALADTGSLTRLPGVGKKLAQRLVLELKDKLAPALRGRGPDSLPSAPGVMDAGGALPTASAWDEAIEALVALGYSRAEASTALTAVRPDLTADAAPSLWVRAGLRHLGTRRAL